MVNRLSKTSIVLVMVMGTACNCGLRHEKCVEEWFEAGMESVQEGRYDNAVEAFSRVLELKPHFVPAHNNRAAARMEMGDYRGTVHDYNRALAVNPGLAEGYNGRGRAFIHLDRIDHALPDLDRAVELAPGFADAYGNRALAHMILGDRENALADIRKAVDLQPGNTVYGSRLDNLQQTVSGPPEE